MKKKSSKLPYKFSIIRQFNSPNSALTQGGYEVKREEKLYIPTMNKWVMCAPYDNHFVYIDPTPISKTSTDRRWLLMCTCGSPAIVVGYNAYKNNASPAIGGDTPGEMLVCYFHAQYNRHAENST